jgi:ATP-dependent Clp protease ATP-binding subunit ClpB
MVRQLDATRVGSKASLLQKAFALRIVGQPKAIEVLTRLVDKFYSGMYDPTKPIGSIIELGPTGTGKTAVAEAFVEGLGGKPNKNLMTVDCGEFQHSHEIAKLQGSPPGYLGHRETKPFFTNGSLWDARCDGNGVEVLPFAVVLWDEIEKASDALWRLMLSILDKARFTTGDNQIVDMSKTVHILTSNVGSSDMSNDDGLGFFTRDEVNEKRLNDIALGAARRKFPPEFLNRLDHVLMFKTLSKDDLRAILGMQLSNIQDRILLQGAQPFELNVAPAALKQLLEEGYDKRYNARHLKRAIELHVFQPLTSLVTTGQVMADDMVVVDYRNGEWEYFAHSNRGQGGASRGKETGSDAVFYT